MDSLFRGSKAAQTKIFTGSGLVCDEPGFVLSVFFSGAAQAMVSVALYDGYSTTSKKIGIMANHQFYGGMLFLNLPIYFAQALYLEEVTNLQECTVQYLCERQLNHICAI